MEALEHGQSAAGGASPRRGPIRLALLGGFDLSLGGVPLAVPMAVQRLLAFLALQERPVRRPFVAGTLWLDAPDDRAAANLRSALWRVRATGQPLIEADLGHLSLAAGVGVDLRATTARARSVLSGSTDPRALEWDASLCKELLPQWYDDWILVERERFRQLRLRALESLCDQMSAVGRFGDAMEAGLGAVAAEPLRESAHRALIRVHLAEGNYGEAVRQFELYRELLDRELGVEPSRMMRALVAPVLAERAGRPGAGALALAVTVP